MTQGGDIVLRGKIKRQTHGKKTIKTLRPREPMSQGKTTLIYYSLVTLSLIPLLVIIVNINHPLGGLVFILYAIICFMQPDWFMKIFDIMVGPWRKRKFFNKVNRTRELLEIPVDLRIEDPQGASPRLSWTHRHTEARTIEEVITKTVAHEAVNRPLEDGQIDLSSPNLRVGLTRDPFDEHTLHLEVRHPTTQQRLTIQLDASNQPLQLAQREGLAQISRRGVELKGEEQQALLRALIRIIQHSGTQTPKEIAALVEV